MDLEIIQKEIDGTCYWDAEVLDFKISYFGDEVELIIQGDSETNFIFKFTHCYQVSYEDTDLINRPNNRLTRDFNRKQLGYYAHDFTLSNSEKEGFIDIKIVAAPLFIKLTFKTLEIKRVPHHDSDFFWNKNKSE